MGCGTSKPPVLNTAHQPQVRPKLDKKPDERRAESHEQSEVPKKTNEPAELEYIDSNQFLSLSYEEVAALRPTDPENMWAIVKKSSDRNREWKLDSVKNRRGWKTIRLFVSSTFRDFHAEREVLVKEVSFTCGKEIGVFNF